jgi:hypothetical protein
VKTAMVALALSLIATSADAHEHRHRKTLARSMTDEQMFQEDMKPVLKPKAAEAWADYEKVGQPKLQPSRQGNLSPSQMEAVRAILMNPYADPYSRKFAEDLLRRQVGLPVNGDAY